MPQIPASFGHRLTRTPSLGDELRQAVVFTSVPMVISGMAIWAWRSDPASAPAWVAYAVPVLGIVLLTLGWNLAARVRRLLRGRVPLIETNCQRWRPGVPAQIRVVDAEVAPLEDLKVFLVAEDVKVERVALTTASSEGWRFMDVVRHHTELLSFSKEALRQMGQLDREATATIPRDSPSTWRWQILVIGTVDRGMPREDRYPLAVALD